MLQQEIPLNGPLYFVAVFAAAVIYYTKAYITEGTLVTTNPRTLWYTKNRKLVINSQWLMGLVITFSVVFLLKDKLDVLLGIEPVEWALILVFPLGGIFYYGVSTQLGRYNLRRIGWLKPFVIGFIWAGLVTIYPVLFYDIMAQSPYEMSLIGLFLFIKNFMFVSVLCIMFDIKDYAADYNAQLKTFVVNVGLRKTIFKIIIPLCVIGLASFLIYGYQRGFHFMKLALNVIPFLLLIIVAYSLHNRRSVLYYLAIIDGLMLVKAICGSLAMIYF